MGTIEDKIITYNNAYETIAQECEMLRSQVREAFAKGLIEYGDYVHICDPKQYFSSVEIIHHLRKLGWRIFMEMLY